VRTGIIFAFSADGEVLNVRADSGEVFSVKRADYRPRGFHDLLEAADRPSIHAVRHHLAKGRRVACLVEDIAPTDRAHYWTFCRPGTLRLQVEITPELAREFWTGSNLVGLQKAFPRRFEDRSADGGFRILLNHADITTWLRANSGTISDQERDVLWQESGKPAWFEVLIDKVWYRSSDPRCLPTMAPRPECMPPTRPRHQTPWR